VPTTKFPLGCRAARAAEAAGTLGGNEVYWKMHDWLMGNQSGFGDATLRRAAAAMGLDPEALFAEMESPEAESAITEDVQAARRLGVRSIPFIFINDKFLPRWNLQGHDILQEVVGEAGR
jgi:predicted DsbA family dithiol-disulfide isomerase